MALTNSEITYSLENIQNSFLRFLYFSTKMNLKYHWIKTKINIMSLKVARSRTEFIFSFKLLIKGPKCPSFNNSIK